MDIHYSNGWFRAMKCPGEIWSSDQARAAYNSRQRHAVVIGPIEKPVAYLEFNDDYIGVGFLDENLRECLNYQFQEVEPGRLFLTMAAHREFVGNSYVTKVGRTYMFERDGKATIRDQSGDSGYTEHQTVSDVSGNWDEYPAFGNHDSLLRAER